MFTSRLLSGGRKLKNNTPVLSPRGVNNNIFKNINFPSFSAPKFSVQTSKRFYSGGVEDYGRHVDTPYNNVNTPFEFTDENYLKIQKILAKYPPDYKRAAMIPLLHLAQDQCGGWLPLVAMRKIAKICEVQEIRVFEVATFYSMFKRDKVGKYKLGVCGTTPCMLCGAQKIMDTIKDYLKIDLNETTEDGMFTLLELECLGACVNAPMMSVGKDYYEDLTPETTINLIKALQRGEKTTPGPQSGLRKVCEPSHQQTSLFNDPVPPPLRTDGKL